MRCASLRPGTWGPEVKADGDAITVSAGARQSRISYTSAGKPSDVSWRDVDVVLECSGKFLTRCGWSCGSCAYQYELMAVHLTAMDPPATAERACSPSLMLASSVSSSRLPSRTSTIPCSTLSSDATTYARFQAKSIPPPSSPSFKGPAAAPDREHPAQPPNFALRLRRRQNTTQRPTRS